MSDPVWYRSLYWRIAFGFIAMLAILLLGAGSGVPVAHGSHLRRAGKIAAQLAALVAKTSPQNCRSTRTRISTRSCSVHFSRVYQPFLVVLANGQRASNRPAGLPPEFASHGVRADRAASAFGERRARGGEPGRERTPHAWRWKAAGTRRRR